MKDEACCAHVVKDQALEVDPEALIKCTTITPGGVASTTPANGQKQTTTIVMQNPPEETLVTKEEPVQIQIDEQSQLTIKTAQNKMLADLLEKKSNPPVQVVQMTGSQINAPTIQITEAGQIVQVKADSNPVIQISSDSGQIVPQPGQYIQIKNDQGQIIHLKNDQGQIIQLKSDQFQTQLMNQGTIVIKNEQNQLVQSEHGQIVQTALQIAVKNEKEQIAEAVVTDHSYTEPPMKKQKLEDKREESVSKTAANLYAALAASALEDEEDLQLPPKQEQVEAIPPPVLVAGTESAPLITIQEPILQVQPSIPQPAVQIQQPTLQVQPALQVQPQTLQVPQPMLQVQPMDVNMQNIIASQAGQIILQEKPIVSQQTQFVQQPMQIIATPSNSQGGISYIAQNIQGNIMQPHKTIIIVQGGTGGGPITLTVNNPGGLDEATLNSLIAQATEAITQQQIIQNSGVIQSAQRVIVSQPTLVTTSQPITMVKTAIAQNAPQLTPSQQPIITAQPQPHKAQIVNQNQPQQIVVSAKPQPTLITSTTISNQNNQIVTVTGNQQIIGGSQLIGNQALITNQQFVTVSANQPLIVNAPIKPAVHRMVQQQPRAQMVTSVITSIADTKTTVIQGAPSPSSQKPTVKPPQPLTRPVITRRPIMIGTNKIGEKEVIVQQTITETNVTKQPPKPPTPKASPTTLTQPADLDNPWICHWRGCGKSLENATAVFGHVARVHCPPGAAGEAPCLWLDCDRVPRRTFALLNHIHDKHCTPEALRAIFVSRRHLNNDNDANKPVSLGYPPNAALAALNKHAVDFLNPRELMLIAHRKYNIIEYDVLHLVIIDSNLHDCYIYLQPGVNSRVVSYRAKVFCDRDLTDCARTHRTQHRAELSRTPEQTDENEGPVTKSIRLTAALILRNIVIYSNTGRRQLRSYEPHLATIALSSVEASRTIAQVLYDMNNI
ncbi:hypothetical protein EVAR_58905_1 [Eumeta japonica]|uniref:C2H2-type domain-containing protein n=1 Tax=Eumeta variegata TaxID=151549 RepID=A0A4C1YB50_EUMVA|nr:hypothetical protein EVAR_58905_1 [Eumeta japonica]